ncbi:MAG: SusD/RagB family nutrient-binding outer membrane lipoprotein [Chitinophagaceae bacterium]|nr:SusD/RagB family nutrient-binding outer membrane lipoprotein [Chitinophagaceae bacterium]
MKKIISTLSITAILLAVFVTSCNKKIDDAYANPNADVRVPVETILPGLISCMAGNGAGHGPLNDYRFIGKYVQNFAFCNTGGQYDQMGGTTGSSDNAASLWRIHYFDIGQNCMNMIKWGQEEEKWNYAGVGKAIFAYSWLALTDYHGEVILKESFNTGQLTFKYDTQEDVYNYVRQLCRESIDLLNRTDGKSTATNLAVGDQYFYGGDVAKWKKFVYSIMARSFHHLTNKATYSADSVVKYCDLAINDNLDNAMVKFAGTSVSGTNNFWGPLRGNLGSTSIGTETAMRQSTFIANLMNGAGTFFTGVQDPRAWYILRGNTNGTIKGVDMNKGQTVIAAADRCESFWGISQNPSVSNTTPSNDANCRFIFRNAAPFPVVTATEIAFIKAEALYRKGDKPGALAAYTDGISKHFDMLTTQFATNVPAAKVITPAMKAAYMADPKVMPATAAALSLSHIMLQKYIALWGYDVLETWTDMRRYHYSDQETGTGRQVYVDFVKPSGGDLFINNNGKMVYRVRPRFNSEYVWNIEELGRIGATALDYHTKEMWFSQP